MSLDLPDHIRRLDGKEARRRLVAAEREAQLWLAVAKVPLTERLLDEARYRLGLAYVAISYLVRPFDMLADARRWWWQRPAECGWGGLTPEIRRHMARQIAELLESDGATGPGWPE